MGRLPYLSGRDVHHRRLEVGRVDSSDLVSVLRAVPLSDTTSFGASFVASNSVVSGSSGDLYVEGGNVRIGDVRGMGGDSVSFESSLTGGRVETLNLSLPRYREGEDGLFTAGERLAVFQGAPLDTLVGQGYEVQASGFRVGHHLYETGGEMRKFFAKSIGGKVVVDTEPMVKGEPERKLVLRYTSDVMDTPEFKAYEAVLGEIKASKAA